MKFIIIVAFTLILLQLLLSIQIINASNSDSNGVTSSSCKKINQANEKYFDYYLLSMTWPGSFCVGKSNCSIPPFVKGFTIHGLWPNSDKNSLGPTCCYNEKLNINEIKPLLPQLQKLWPSFSQNTNEQFWEHEWLKHGTCSLKNLKTNTQFNYFQNTLQLVEKLKIFEKLKKYGIVPTSSNSKQNSVITYKRDWIESVLDLVDLYGIVACSKDGKYLSELRFCVDKELRVVECSESVIEGIHEHNKCNDSIYFPEIEY
ncbi:hypothetical protein ABK040_011234 [Willaertia magna]